MAWTESVIGALVMGSGVPIVDMVDVRKDSHLEKKMEEIMERVLFLVCSESSVFCRCQLFFSGQFSFGEHAKYIDDIHLLSQVPG